MNVFLPLLLLITADSPVSVSTGEMAPVVVCSQECPEAHHTLWYHWNFKYHRRVYYGYFVRPPYDYRRQFDYPWKSGPSLMHWPIHPLPVTADPELEPPSTRRIDLQHP